jgi:hypothetical protein
MLTDRASIRAILPQDVRAQQLSQAIDVAKVTAHRLDERYGRRATLPSLLRRVESAEDQLVITLDRGALARMVGLLLVGDQDGFVLKTRSIKTKVGYATKLVIGNVTPSHDVPDQRLIALLRDAQEAQAMVMAAPDTGLTVLARQRGQCRHRLTKLVRISWLSPKIVAMILAGE